MNKNLPIIISSLSFVVSLLTLYLMQLRPANYNFTSGGNSKSIIRETAGLAFTSRLR